MYTIDHRATLLDQFEGLKTLPMFQRMERTVEGSPWHREDNVLVHTGMVLDEYVKLMDQQVAFELGETWVRAMYIGGIAAAFHDVGKPLAETKKYSEERGEYRGYGGHELLSARMFETYAVERSPMFSPAEIFLISWMIEHHLFWNASPTKQENMARTLLSVGTAGPPVFAALLLADQYGRISDDPEKDSKAKAYVDDFMQLVKTVNHTPTEKYPGQRTMYLPIAPSGAGKSTYLKELRETSPDVHVFSLDALRHEWYHPTDYRIAYEKAVADNKFEGRANARFHADVKHCVANNLDLYVDNTNLSARRRKWYIDIARKQGFYIVAVMMPVALSTLLERQKTRGDKTVPESAVKQQYNALQTPMIGEVDQIIVSTHNLAPR